MQKKVAQNRRYHKIFENLLGNCLIFVSMTYPYFKPKHACNPRLAYAKCRSKRNRSLQYFLGSDKTLLGQFTG